MAQGNDERLLRIFEATRTIAVLGAHRSLSKPAHFVPRALAAQGFEVLPVNPVIAPASLFGKNAVAKLADLTQPVDLVLVFRRPEHLAGHAEEIAAMKPLPSYAWFQLGIVHDAAAARLEGEGIEVVQDRCMWTDYRRLVRSSRRQAS